MNEQRKVTIYDVEKKTRTFLDIHWPSKPMLPSQWHNYNFIGAVPDGDKQGCYVLVEKDEVVYIGLGASRCGGIYKEHGIGARLNCHVLSWDKTIPTKLELRVYKPQAKWEGVTEIYTYALPSGYGYLACALEAYLISELEPKRNVTKTSRASNQSLEKT